MPDVMAPGAPLWWVRKLGKQLDDRKKELQRYDDYYEGKHPLAFATIKFETVFGDLFKGFSDNWCELVVDAVDERLTVEGFRLGKDAAGARKAWGYWQTNHLDAESKLGHNTALVLSEAYGLVWADPDTQAPVITVESPFQMAVATEAGNRRRRRAALKRWVDDDGYELATLYLPDFVFKYRSRRPVTGFGAQFYSGDPQMWEERPVSDGEPWPLPNPLGVVPVVPLVNRPRLLKYGVSEIKRVMPLQDAVNKMVEDMLVASEFGAAPQRWATGLEIPVDPITKKPLDVFEHMINRLWTNKKAEGRFGQFAQTDLGIFVKAIEMLVQHIASQTRTPPHYFALAGQFPSGEALPLDTEIATPDGWRPIGDLVVGDEVFDPDGQVQVVEEAFPVLTNRPCYELTFDDGSTVVADGGHRWETFAYPTRCSQKRRRAVVTTEEIAATLTVPRGKKRASANHWVPLASALDYPAVDLPVDPYVLGCWLGDGSRGHGHLTCHVNDAEHFRSEWAAAGEEVRVYAPSPDRPAIRRVHAARRTDGSTLRGRLNQLGILNAKQIPALYMLAPAKDRLALLQGLMDTDGTVNRGQGSVSFSASNEVLARDVLELVHSLGHKAALAGSLDDHHGYRISWSALDPVFRLGRKLDLQRTQWAGIARVTGRYVVAVREVPSVPVRCIQVSGDRHLFIATRQMLPTHNSIKSAETGLVAKVHQKMLHFGEAWEEILGLAFLVDGDAKRYQYPAMETIWKDPEFRSEGEHVDAVIKRKALNVPDEQLWEDVGYSPQQIEAFKAMRAAEPPVEQVPVIPTETIRA